MEFYLSSQRRNHLIYFLNKKIDHTYKSPDIQTCIEECATKVPTTFSYYDSTKIFKSPEESPEEKTAVKPAVKPAFKPAFKPVVIKTEEKTDVIKTMTIMKWIDNLCDPNYMMFCMIRQENDKCIDSAATLNFANSIKST